MAIAFDTLAYARRLAGAGVPDEQAAAHAEALASAMGQELPTRRDLEALATKEDLHVLEARIARLETRLESGLSSLETRLTMRFGAIVVAALGAMTAITRLL